MRSSKDPGNDEAQRPDRGRSGRCAGAARPGAPSGSCRAVRRARSPRPAPCRLRRRDQPCWFSCLRGAGDCVCCWTRRSVPRVPDLFVVSGLRIAPCCSLRLAGADSVGSIDGAAAAVRLALRRPVSPVEGGRMRGADSSFGRGNWSFGWILQPDKCLRRDTVTRSAFAGAGVGRDRSLLGAARAANGRCRSSSFLRRSASSELRNSSSIWNLKSFEALRNSYISLPIWRPICGSRRGPKTTSASTIRISESAIRSCAQVDWRACAHEG